MRRLVISAVLLCLAIIPGCRSVNGICQVSGKPGHYYIIGTNLFTGSAYVYEWKTKADGTLEKVRTVW